MFIFAGDFQAQVPGTTQQTIGTKQTPPPQHLLLHNLTKLPYTYTSAIPAMHPTKPYITHWGHKSGRALDHILLPQDNLQVLTHAGIDHTYTHHHIDTDYDLIYADINTSTTNTTQPSTTDPPRANFRAITNIPVIMQPPSDDDESPPWYVYNENAPQPPTQPQPHPRDILATAHEHATSHQEATSHLKKAQELIKQCHADLRTQQAPLPPAMPPAHGRPDAPSP